jgi:hypothetical protein
MTEAEIVSAIVSANLHRRHLTTQQRAHIAVELANGSWGGDRSKVPFGTLTKPTTTIKAAASALQVSERSVKRAAEIKKADPEAHQAAMRGERQARRNKPASAKSETEPKPALAAAATVEAPPRHRPPPAEAKAVLEAMDNDPQAFRDSLRIMLDFEYAHDVAALLNDVFNHRNGFALEVAQALCAIAEQPLPAQRQLAS